ncbi:MAG: transcription antitermination factor NusB [Gammaproteobacteria bacterium]|jgi:N utilization substance protein B|tara:strand:- start:731 stop:1126 length:396 start_codon:yes stop_codon:yes gene_type:complete
MVKKDPSPAKLRELVMQALYQKEISGSSNTDLIKQFKQNYKNFNLSDFEIYLKEIKKNILDIDTTIEKYTNIQIDQISKIELAILKQAVYEIRKDELDKPIIISEAIRLSKRFGQDSSHKFINALLDKAAK